jgi:hypothetical protein
MLQTLTQYDKSLKDNNERLKENARRIVADKQNTSIDKILSKLSNHPKQDVAAIMTSK